MKRVILSCVLLGIVFSFARGLEVRGKIISIEGTPIANAVVYHPDSGKKSITDENGYYSLDLPGSESVSLEVFHEAYHDKFVTISPDLLDRGVVIKLVPYIRQRERVVVTALRYPESEDKVPAAETVVTQESLNQKMAPNLATSMAELPGVSNIGAGGFTIVPNIRGLARRRVLILVDNARVTSDRRTGPSASFVNSNDIEKIEVLRSPSSVFYGSDAIGGVIHIITRQADMDKPLGGRFYAKYGVNNQEKNLGLALQGKKENNGYYLSFQALDAQNYSSPNGEVMLSQFTQGSLFGRFIHSSKKREINISYLGARGYDIGKANSDSTSRPTWYPLETQNLFRIHWLEKEVGEKGQINAQVFINPNFLETQKERINGYKTQEAYSKTQSVDHGIHLSYGKKLGLWRINGGIDYFGRSNAQAFNRYTDFDSSGNVIDVRDEYAYSSGSRKDLGFFISADYTGIKNLDLVGGMRWDYIVLQAAPEDKPPKEKSDYSALTGFMGASYSFLDGFSAFANISRAYRVPSLSELFYTGITGRGFIISQSDLDPETSTNIDCGLRFINKRFFWGAYAFYYRLDDLIERYMPVENIYTYGNVNKGRILGFELEVEYYPMSGWKVFGNFFAFSGKSQETKDYLNDVPSPRLYLGTRFWIRYFSIELNGTIQWEKDNPGPAEVSIPGYQILNMQASYQFNPSFQIHAVLSNLLNAAYIARPDSSAVEEPGRNFVLGLTYDF